MDKLDMKTVEQIKKDYVSGKRCRCCGMETVDIRGRHPGDPKRKVCPQCLAEKIDQVREILEPTYGMGMTEDIRPVGKNK